MLAVLKLVPRSHPNDDGHEVLADVPPTFRYSKAINVTGDGLDEPHFCVMMHRAETDVEPQITFKDSWYKDA